MRTLTFGSPTELTDHTIYFFPANWARLSEPLQLLGAREATHPVARFTMIDAGLSRKLHTYHTRVAVIHLICATWCGHLLPRCLSLCVRLSLYYCRLSFPIRPLLVMHAPVLLVIKLLSSKHHY